MTTRVRPIPPLIPKSLPAEQDKTDVLHIRGNVSDDTKRLGMRIFAYFVSTPDKSYGAAVGQRLKLVEVNVWGNGASASGETIFEIGVTKGAMSQRSNFYSIISVLPFQICAIFLEHCTVLALPISSIREYFFQPDSKYFCTDSI